MHIKSYIDLNMHLISIKLCIKNSNNRLFNVLTGFFFFFCHKVLWELWFMTRSIRWDLLYRSSLNICVCRIYDSKTLSNMTLTARAISSQSIEFLPLLLLYVYVQRFFSFFWKIFCVKIFTNDISFKLGWRWECCIFEIKKVIFPK